MLPKTADIIILCAGVMAASIAFRVAKRAAGNILVLDKGYVENAGVDDRRRLCACTTAFPPEVQAALGISALRLCAGFSGYWMGKLIQQTFVRSIGDDSLRGSRSEVNMNTSTIEKAEA